ncbi:MAG TPA: ADP/ATP-dependent (S)-NAD(P)H-hydrate dehydratase [Microbacteriaceae bacterium]|nr:ADP/ATP-dependent (S)-NAD(P)H-hydrate dehydratase [Microbacteriaceae bacterium]
MSDVSGRGGADGPRGRDGEAAAARVRLWEAADAARWVAVPGPESDKYSHGVLGVVTGSALFPGAAVLGVEAAHRTGVGMVRYLGDPRPTDLVLRRRPETVMVPGRVEAWLIGSGADRGAVGVLARWREALASGLPVVVDAGALDLVEVGGPGAGSLRPWVLTPHYRELARLLNRLGPAGPADRGEASSRVAAGGAPADGAAPGGFAAGEATPEAIAREPERWARRAARLVRAVVLLKGRATHVATPDGDVSRVVTECGWLATAGTGDVLAGILGALLATHPAATRPRELAALAATAAFLHGRAGLRASSGGPIAALDVAESLPGAIAELLSSGALGGRRH